MPHETLVEERLDGIEVGSGDSFRRNECAAAGEHRQGPEDRLLLLAQEVVRPGDRRLERALALLDVAVARSQELELLGQSLVDRCRRQRTHAGGRELDRERELIDSVADRVHMLVRLKAGAHRRGALDEEHVAVACRHWWNLVVALGPKTQALTAGRDNDHVGAAGHELADELGNPCDEVLAVVDDDQRPPRVE